MFLHIQFVLHILLFLHFSLFYCTFYLFRFLPIYIYSCAVLLLYNLIVILFLIFFYSLHCPLSGPDLTYISLLIIPCIIYHVTNKETLNLKFLAMQITNHILCLYIIMVGNLQNIFMEHDLNILMIFDIKEKCIILTHTLAIVTDIPVLLMTAFVLQGHVSSSAFTPLCFGRSVSLTPVLGCKLSSVYDSNHAKEPEFTCSLERSCEILGDPRVSVYCNLIAL